MKYCLSARQPKAIQSKADELLVMANDHKYIPELFIDFSDKMIILDLPFARFDELRDAVKTYAEAGAENFCCRIDNLLIASWFKDNNIKFYYKYPASTFYEVNDLISLGVEYVAITAPLTFKMNMLHRNNRQTKYRMVPNVSYDAYIPRENGIYGQWVRPEDIKYYEKGIYVFEFDSANDLIKEKTLYHIYAEQKNWPGNLNLLITNFNINVDNRLLPDNIGEIRSTCGQRCQETGRCHICKTAIDFENTIQKYKPTI